MNLNANQTNFEHSRTVICPRDPKYKHPATKPLWSRCGKHTGSATNGIMQGGVISPLLLGAHILRNYWWGGNMKFMATGSIII